MMHPTWLQYWTAVAALAFYRHDAGRYAAAVHQCELERLYIAHGDRK